MEADDADQDAVVLEEEAEEDVEKVILAAATVAVAEVLQLGLSQTLQPLIFLDQRKVNPTARLLMEKNTGSNSKTIPGMNVTNQLQVLFILNLSQSTTNKFQLNPTLDLQMKAKP